ncbi:MAG: hypothetical protein AAGE84_20970 [Cyanobacteria bacterium P01_G01_bin.39]
MKSLSAAFSFGIAALSLIIAQAPAQADSAVRGAYSEVRANGSSFAAAFEHVLPDGVYFDVGVGGDDAAGTAPTAADVTMSVDITAAGTNQSEFESITITGLATNDAGVSSLEEAIANAVNLSVDGTAVGFLEEEDIIGLVRSFTGPEGVGATANPSATLD